MLEAEAVYTRILFHGMVLVYNNSLEEKPNGFLVTAVTDVHISRSNTTSERKLAVLSKMKRKKKKEKRSRDKL